MADVLPVADVDGDAAQVHRGQAVTTVPMPARLTNRSAKVPGVPAVVANTVTVSLRVWPALSVAVNVITCLPETRFIDVDDPLPCSPLALSVHKSARAVPSSASVAVPENDVGTVGGPTRPSCASTTPGSLHPSSTTGRRCRPGTADVSRGWAGRPRRRGPDSSPSSRPTPGRPGGSRPGRRRLGGRGSRGRRRCPRCLGCRPSRPPQ